MIQAGTSAVIPTGLAIRIPKGYSGRLATKSVQAWRYSLITLGGTIDPGYSKEIYALLHVSQQSTFLYSPRTRIWSSRPDAWSTQDVIQAGRSVRPPSPGKASAPLRMRVDTSSYAGACVVKPSEKAL